MVYSTHTTHTLHLRIVKSSINTQNTHPNSKPEKSCCRGPTGKLCWAEREGPLLYLPLVSTDSIDPLQFCSKYISFMYMRGCTLWLWLCPFYIYKMSTWTCSRAAIGCPRNLPSCIWHFTVGLCLLCFKTPTPPTCLGLPPLAFYVSFIFKTIVVSNINRIKIPFVLNVKFPLSTIASQKRTCNESFSLKRPMTR